MPMDESARHSDTIRVYKDKAGLWRWKRVAPNGAVTADGGEGYSTREHGVRAADREADGKADVVVIE